MNDVCGESVDGTEERQERRLVAYVECVLVEDPDALVERHTNWERTVKPQTRCAYPYVFTIVPIG